MRLMRAASEMTAHPHPALRGAAVVMAALTLVGCESSQEQSAKLERAAKLAAAHEAHVDKGLTITRESTDVKVLSANVVTSSEGAAAVVTVRNDSSQTLASVPIALACKLAPAALPTKKTWNGAEAPGASSGSTALPAATTRPARRATANTTSLCWAT